MSSGQIIALVALVVVVDLTIIPIIMHAIISSSWNDLAKKFPTRSPLPDAVRRDFQSLGIDLSSFGGCVHIAADETHLHFLPARFLRWFNAQPMSIPWESIESVEPAWPRKYMKARIAGRKISAPKWALEIAAVTAPASGKSNGAH